MIIGAITQVYSTFGTCCHSHERRQDLHKYQGVASNPERSRGPTVYVEMTKTNDTV